MGADLYWLEKDIDEDNGRLAENILGEIIDVFDDDKPFKEVRIQRLVDKYQNERKSI